MRSNMLQYLTFSIWLLWFTGEWDRLQMHTYLCSLKSHYVIMLRQSSKFLNFVINNLYSIFSLVKGGPFKTARSPLIDIWPLEGPLEA